MMTLQPAGKNLISDATAAPDDDDPSSSSLVVREELMDFSDDDRSKLPSAPVLDDPPPPPPFQFDDDDLDVSGCGDEATKVNAGNPPDSEEDKQATIEIDLHQEVAQVKAEGNKEEGAGAEMVVATKSLAPSTVRGGTIGKSNAQGTLKMAIRTRSEESMICDGCRWRKYGRKKSKRNPFPRAYYKCTMGVACPVRKQVQRSGEKQDILVTTYEGEHNHALPPVAMAMVSATTSAARMLISGSMSSPENPLMMMNPDLIARPINPTTSTCRATLSTSGPLLIPTIVLDFTHDTNDKPNQSAPTVPLLPHQPHGLHNQSQFSGLQLSHQDAARSFPQAAAGLHQTQQLSFDGVSTAAATLTSDPNFTALVAAAISSVMSGAQHNNNNNNDSNPNSINNSSTNSSFSGN